VDGDESWRVGVTRILLVFGEIDDGYASETRFELGTWPVQGIWEGC
jgi:hypothetical protein